MVFVPLLLWLIFLSSWGLFSKLQKEKKEKEKVGRSFSPSFVLLHIIAEKNGGRGEETFPLFQ